MPPTSNIKCKAKLTRKDWHDVKQFFLNAAEAFKPCDELGCIYKTAALEFAATLPFYDAFMGHQFGSRNKVQVKLPVPYVAMICAFYSQHVDTFKLSYESGVRLLVEGMLNQYGKDMQRHFSARYQIKF